MLPPQRPSVDGDIDKCIELHPGSVCFSQSTAVRADIFELDADESMLGVPPVEPNWIDDWAALDVLKSDLGDVSEPVARIATLEHAQVDQAVDAIDADTLPV